MNIRSSLRVLHTLHFYVRCCINISHDHIIIDKISQEITNAIMDLSNRRRLLEYILKAPFVPVIDWD